MRQSRLVAILAIVAMTMATHVLPKVFPNDRTFCDRFEPRGPSPVTLAIVELRRHLEGLNRVQWKTVNAIIRYQPLAAGPPTKQSARSTTS